jgi:hypothetical protein
MNYAVETGSGAMIYIPSLIKIGSGIQKLIRGIHTETALRSHKPTFIFYFLQNKESRLTASNLICRVSVEGATFCRAR